MLSLNDINTNNLQRIQLFWQFRQRRVERIVVERTIGNKKNRYCHTLVCECDLHHLQVGERAKRAEDVSDRASQALAQQRATNSMITRLATQISSI
jgi:hypothetical protein